MWCTTAANERMLMLHRVSFDTKTNLLVTGEERDSSCLLGIGVAGGSKNLQESWDICRKPRNLTLDTVFKSK